MTERQRNDAQGRGWPASPHEATRFILEQLPGCVPVEGAPTDAERIARADERPELVVPSVLDGSAFTSLQVADPTRDRGTSAFAGFLDGAQDVRVVNQSGGIPIVWATVSAAVRARVDRRLVSWRGHPPVVSGRYYIPFRYVDGLRDDLRNHPLVVDTAAGDASGKFPSRHPAALMEAAVKRVQQDRERVEHTLAEAWCSSETEVLYADGSIAGSAITSASRQVVGVIKSHRRLYAEGDAFEIVAGLPVGSRTSIFRVAPRSGFAVASWYLRIRSPLGRDALFGLIRVEAAITDDVTERADDISRWLVAEGSPLALPDGRWDKMAYGIRHTEEFLRAIS